MALTRGIQTTRGSTAAKLLKVSSVLPVALVLTAPVSIDADIYYFDSPEKALSELKTLAGGAEEGNWEKYLDLWVNRFPNTVQTVISIAHIGADDDETKGNIIDAINLLKDVRSRFDIRPDLFAVADYPADVTIVNSIKAICEVFKGRTYYDIDVSTSSAAALFRNEISSDRISLIKTPLGTFNTDTNSDEWYDGGVVATMFRSFLDGKKTYGWFDSLSNRAINMDSIKNTTAFYDGADETDPLTEVQVWPVIKDNGIKFWSSDATCSDDLTWRDGLHVRIVDLMAETVRRDLASSIDKDLAELVVVKKSIQAFSNSLVGAGLLLGGEIQLDENATTEEMVAEGDFVFIFDFQRSPKIRKVTINFNAVTSYSSVVYKLLEEA